VLDEKALRKPGFQPGFKIKLADGQEWVFPKPRLRFFPKIGDDGSVGVDGGATFGSECDGQLDAIFGVDETDAFERLRLKFEMAVRLLGANYELKPEDYRQLIVLEPGDDASETMWEELTALMAGNTPKLLPAI
jgi:hypothetical protein